MQALVGHARSIWLQHDTRALAVSGFVIGVSSHLLYWIHGLRAPQAARIFWSHVAAFALTTALSVYTHGVVNGIQDAGALNGSYLAGVYTSMGIYRVFFHRLSRFPGPFPAKLSKLYSTWTARRLDAHNDLMALHERYGDIVRSGKFSHRPCFGRLRSPEIFIYPPVQGRWNSRSAQAKRYRRSWAPTRPAPSAAWARSRYSISTELSAWKLF